MKILILTDRLDVGGAETHIALLARELIKDGHEVTVASSGGAIAERLKNSKITDVHSLFLTIIFIIMF